MGRSYFGQVVLVYVNGAKQMGEATRPVPIDNILDVQTDEFLAEVYRLDHTNIQIASFKVYDQIERLLFGGSYDLCDRILARANVERLSTAVMRSFLTITWESRMKLKEREKFHARVEREMTGIRGAKATKRLLDRLS